MKKRIIATILFAALALTACGDKKEDANGESEGREQVDTEATADDTEQPDDIIDLEHVGTYIGADGSYLTLLDDGTADYYYSAYDNIEHGNEWSCVNGTLFVTLDEMESKISADIPASGNEYTFVEISGYWDDEKFRKVTSVSETPSIEEYQQLRSEAVPMQDKEQMNGFNAATNATCVVAGMQFEIPSYWTAFDTEDEDVAGYSIMDGEPGTMMIIEHFEENQTLTNSSAVDCAYYIKRLINSDRVSWLSSCENVSDQVAKAVGTTVMTVAETDYDEEFGFAFRINEGTNDVYLIEVYQPLDTEKGYLDDVVRIAESGTPVQGEADTESTENTTESATTAESSSGLDPEFKKAMDSYEAFFDKYVEFMNTYSTSNNTVGMLTEYAEFMAQYADTMQKLDAIDESQLTPEEDAYYIQVMVRINAKLAQAVQ